MNSVQVCLEDFQEVIIKHLLVIVPMRITLSYMLGERQK